MILAVARDKSILLYLHLFFFLAVLFILPSMLKMLLEVSIKIISLKV